MKLLFILLSVFTININLVIAHEGGHHTPNICSVTNSCAHLKFDEYPTSKSMSSFLIHILPANPNSLIENLSAKLWMDMGNGHGHGSAPLVITNNEEENHYDVTNGWFVMPGIWQVILKYKENGLDQQIILPIVINE